MEVLFVSTLRSNVKIAHRITPEMRYGQDVAKPPEIKYGQDVAKPPEIRYGQDVAKPPEIRYGQDVVKPFFTMFNGFNFFLT